MKLRHDCGVEWRTAGSEVTRRSSPCSHRGLLARLIDRSPPVLACAWVAAVAVGWRVGMSAHELLGITLWIGLLWAYAREHADASRILREMDTIVRTNGGVSETADRAAATFQATRRMGQTARHVSTWGMALVAIAVGTGLVTALFVGRNVSPPASKTYVVVASGHIDAGTALSISNVAYARMSDSFLTGYAYVPLKDAYVLLGHRLLSSVDYAQLIQWTNTDVVIAGAQPDWSGGTRSRNTRSRP